MKKIIHKIRLQPAEIRTLIAVGLAFLLTAGIGFFWGLSLMSGSAQKNTYNSSPLNDLFSNIKNVVNDSSQDSSPLFQNQQTIEIVDQTSSIPVDESVQYDETNPYQQ